MEREAGRSRVAGGGSSVAVVMSLVWSKEMGAGPRSGFEILSVFFFFWLG